MPHLTIEYSENVRDEVEPMKLLRALHASVKACPGIDISRLKSRAIAAPVVISGDAGAELRMIHVTLAVLSGRDETTRKSYGQILFNALQSEVSGKAGERRTSLTVEIREMDRACYFRN